MAGEAGEFASRDEISDEGFDHISDEGFDHGGPLPSTIGPLRSATPLLSTDVNVLAGILYLSSDRSAPARYFRIDLVCGHKLGGGTIFIKADVEQYFAVFAQFIIRGLQMGRIFAFSPLRGPARLFVILFSLALCAHHSSHSRLLERTAQHSH
jgi:hypothetical protein